MTAPRPTLVVGVDPGPVPGIVGLVYEVDGARVDKPMVLQCDHYSADFFVQAIIAAHPLHRTILAVEQFVVGNRAARSSTSIAGQTTRELIGQLLTINNCRVVLAPAVRVKAWATDQRLDKAGLLKPTEGMRHARDGARHAIYAAVHERVARDPLSKATGGIVTGNRPVLVGER